MGVLKKIPPFGDPLFLSRIILSNVSGYNLVCVFSCYLFVGDSLLVVIIRVYSAVITVAVTLLKTFSV